MGDESKVRILDLQAFTFLAEEAKDLRLMLNNLERDAGVKKFIAEFIAVLCEELTTLMKKLLILLQT